MGGTVARLNVPVGRLAADGHAFPPAGKRRLPPGGRRRAERLAHGRRLATASPEKDQKPAAGWPDRL